MADSEVEGTDSVDVHEEKEKESKSEGGEPAKLFVGQVPQQMGEAELRKILEPFGTVQEIAILKDKASGSHKGCAFVTYASRESAERAIEALHNKTTLHHTKRPLQVKFAGGDQEGGGAGGDVKLFVGMLSRSTTEGQITELFSVYGPVKEVHLMKDSSSRSKGCAFVRMESRTAAQKAIVGLHDVYQDSGAPRKLIVKYADTKQERAQRQIVKQIQLNPFGVGGLQGLLGGLGQMAAGLGGGYGAPLAPPALGGGGGGYFASSSEGYGHGGDSGYGAPSHHYGYPRQEPHHMGGGSHSHQTRGPNGANLFIYNVPETFSDADLQSMFSNFGAVLSATIFKDKVTGVSRGFGFVSYDNPMSAEKAIVALNGFHIGNKRLKVMLKTSAGGGGSSSSSGRGFAPY